MKCPQCKAINTCGCKSCFKNRPKDRNTAQIRMSNGDAACPSCGFEAGLEQWADWEFAQRKSDGSGG